MSAAEVVMLVVAGVGGGLAGSVAGLASLVSYPALLAVGLAPITANVANTVALVGSSAGSVAGSRPELADQWPGVRRLASAGIAGGALGGALLLLTPDGSFERLVPWLIAGASLAILIRRPAAHLVDGGPIVADAGPRVLVVVAVVGIYGGYFGAGAGVMLLALLLHVTSETLARANAVKNVVLGAANAIAAVAFAVFGDVRWAAVLPLALGLIVGGRIGPIVVRRAPVGPLRLLIAAAGIGLAVKLGIDAYG